MITFAKFRHQNARTAISHTFPVACRKDAATHAFPCVLGSHHTLLACRREGWKSVPLSNLHVAQGQAVSAPFEQLELQKCWGLIRRMKCREPLLTRITSEQHRLLLDHVHREHGLQRTFFQDYIKLRHPDWKARGRNDQEALAQLTNTRLFPKEILARINGLAFPLQ